jgi:MoxR-like ATPase
VVAADQVVELVSFARAVHVAPPIEEYAVALSHATRHHADLRLGASPRATLQLVRAAKVWAALDGRGFVIPDDITALLVPVFAHRLIATRSAGGARARGGADAITTILERIAASVRVPIAQRQ